VCAYKLYMYTARFNYKYVHLVISMGKLYKYRQFAQLCGYKIYFIKFQRLNTELL